MHPIPAMLKFNEQIEAVEIFQIRARYIKVAAIQGGRDIRIYLGARMKAKLAKQALLIFAELRIGHSER